MVTRQNQRFVADRRRQRVADLYLQGLGQVEIAGRLKIDQATVSRDLEKLRQDWRSNAAGDFQELKDRELRKIDLLERESWEGWNRSLSATDSGAERRGEKVESRQGKRRGGETEEKRVGEPRFLEMVNRCIQQRRALLGLDAPAALPLTGEGFREQVSLEVRRQRVVELLTEFGVREATGGDRAGSDGVQPGGLRLCDQRREVAPGGASAEA